MRIPVAALLLSLCAGPVAAREEPEAPPPPREEIPVGDLVRAASHRSPPRPVSALSGSYGDPDTGLESEGEGTAPLADPDELLDLLPSLLEKEEVDGRVLDGRLLVPAGSGPAVGAAVDRIRARRPADFAISLVLEEAGNGGWKTLLAASEPVRPGTLLTFVDARDRTYVADFDVEIAQDSQIPDPIAMVLRTGASISLRLLPLPRGDAAVVEVVARVSEALPREEADTGYAEMGPIDRGAVTAAEAAVVFRVAPGAESVHGWRGRDGRFFRLRLTTLWTPPPADTGRGAVLWSPLFHLQPRGRAFVGHLLDPAGAEVDGESLRFGRVWEGEGVGFDERMERTFEGLGERVECGAGATEGGLAVFAGRDARKAADAMAASMNGEFRAVPFDVEVRQTVPGAADGGKVLLMASGSLVPGIGGYMRSGEARGYVQDWDVEVAQGAWIPDPVIGRLQTGDFLNLRLLDDGKGGIDAVDLDLQMARIEGIESVEIPLLNAMDRSAGSPSGTAAGTPRRTAYRIERPSVREVRIAGRYALRADGTVTVTRAAPGFLGGAGQIVVTVKVR